MDTAQRIADLLQTCVWVKEPAVAVQILPSFAEDVPGLVALPGQRQDGQPSLPLSCVPAVAGPLARVLATAGLAAAREDGAARVDQLDDASLMADPLVLACAALLREAAVPGLRAHAAPALALAWAAPRMLGGEARHLPGVDPDDLRGLDQLVGFLGGLDPVARGAALHRVGWELSGRLAAAVGAAARAGLPVPAGGLLRALASNRLLLAYPRGTLDREPALEEVAGLLGAGLDARMAGAAVAAARAALEASAERRSKGKAEGIDLALAAHLPGGDDPMRALLHPVAGPLLLGSLGSLVGARELKKAGLDGGTAKALLKPAAHRALAAAWGDISGPLRAWDVLSALVDRVLPLRRKDGCWAAGGGALRGVERWDMLVPGGRPPEERCVVAVRLTALRRAVDEAARTVPGLDGAGAIERAWTDLVSEAGVPVACLSADHGLAAFSAPQSAVRFALRAAAALSGPREVLAGPTDIRLTLPDGARPAVGVALGSIRGGTDGDRTVLGGAAVAQALALTGAGGLSGIATDPSGLRRAAVGGSGLQSEGIVVDPEVSARMLGWLRQSGAPLHLDGEATPVGGLGEDFRATPVRGWWDAGKPGIVVFIRLADAPDAAVELLPLDAEELAGFHAVDREQARLAAVPVATTASAPDDMLDGEFDPFATEETAAFKRPVAAPAVASPGPAADPARADPMDEVYEGLEPSVSFMGIEGSGFEALDTDQGVDEDLSGEFAAAAILSGGEEFEDDEEDSAAPHLNSLSGGGSGGAEAFDEAPSFEGDAPVDGPTDWAAPNPVGRLAMLDEPEPPAASAPMLLDDDGFDAPADDGGPDDGGFDGPSAPMLLDDDGFDAPVEAEGPDNGGFEGPSAPMMLDDDGFDAPAEAEGPDDGGFDGPSAPMMLDEEEEHEPAALVEDDDEPSDMGFADGPSADSPSFVGAEAVAPAGFGFVPDAVATAGPELEIEDDWDEEYDDDEDSDWEAAVRSSASDRGAEVEMLRAGAEADLELVGVAGFSLQAGASAQGSAKDPYFDPEEYTGFYDERGRDAPPRLIDEAPRDPDAPAEAGNLTELEPTSSLMGFKADNSADPSSRAEDTADSLVSSQGQAMFEASAQVAFGLVDAPEPEPVPVDGAMLAELMRTFRGYVVLEDDGEYTFGLRDGGLIRDAHSYDTDGDEAAAYRQFLQAKIADGFIPRPDRVVALLPGVGVGGLDEWRLQQAYQEIGG
jgi:hypothetical protein